MTDKDLTNKIIPLDESFTKIFIFAHMQWTINDKGKLGQVTFSPGEYSWEFLVGVCRPVLHLLTLFQTKKCVFPHPFSDQTSKIHTHFQTWPLGRNYVSICLDYRAKKISSNAFRICIFLKWAKCIPIFRPKRPKYKGVSPPPGCFPLK